MNTTLSPTTPERRWLATAEVVIVAAIWSSSFVGVKVLLEYTGPVTIAGLRYTLAFVMLLPLFIRRNTRIALPSRSQWKRLGLMGLCQYTLGNGALFWALKEVTATAGSLVLCLVPIAVLGLETAWLKEPPRRLQLLGILAAVGGGVLFFASDLEPPPAASLGALIIALLSFAVLPVLARQAARDRQLPTLPLTALPLGLGGIPLVALALIWEGVPSLPPVAWSIVLGLALVNTALAYMLYTHALVRLKATEANVVLNLVPVGTALLGWLVLGERLHMLQLPAVAVVVLGVTLVQRRSWRWTNT